jgi:hypothetical protein
MAAPKRPPETALEKAPDSGALGRLGVVPLVLHRQLATELYIFISDLLTRW